MLNNKLLFLALLWWTVPPIVVFEWILVYDLWVTIYDVAYWNSTYVVWTTNWNVLTSTDWTTWNTNYLWWSSATINQIIFWNWRFIALDAYNIYSSIDWINWIIAESWANPRAWCWTGNKFVISSTNQVWESSNWTSFTSNVAPTSWWVYHTVGWQVVWVEFDNVNDRALVNIADDSDLSSWNTYNIWLDLWITWNHSYDTNLWVIYSWGLIRIVIWENSGTWNFYLYTMLNDNTFEEWNVFWDWTRHFWDWLVNYRSILSKWGDFLIWSGSAWSNWWVIYMYNEWTWQVSSITFHGESSKAIAYNWGSSYLALNWNSLYKTTNLNIW